MPYSVSVIGKKLLLSSSRLQKPISKITLCLLLESSFRPLVHLEMLPKAPKHDCTHSFSYQFFTGAEVVSVGYHQASGDV